MQKDVVHEPVTLPRQPKPVVQFLRRFAKNGWAMVGLILVLLSLCCALFAPLIAPFDPDTTDLSQRLAPPTFLDNDSPYLLGADQIGRDLLSRIIYGARISLLVGVVSVAISMVIGVTLGLIAGFYGKWIDDLIMRTGDIQLSFPFILLAIIVMAIFGSGLWKLVLILGLANWVSFARLVRGETVSIKEMEYVQAARVVGGTNFTLIVRHILPNVASSIIVLATLTVAVNILLESSLTFLGLGVDPSIPTWGGLLADGRNYIATAWWVATFPGFAIMLTVFGINLLGDWLRDELDSNLRLGG